MKYILIFMLGIVIGASQQKKKKAKAKLYLIKKRA